MDNIITKYKINQEVELHLSEKTYLIIGYEYIEGRGIRYICTNGSDARKYVHDCEIKSKPNKRSIGFSCEK